MSNFNENQKIAQAMPIMRSIRIGSAPSTMPMMPLRSTIKQQHQHQQQHQQQHTVKVASRVVPSWKLTSELPELSELYPLERCHIEIEGADDQQVATRISNALKKASISANFENSTAIATTMGHVTFAINLFRTRSAVVVECQRLSGCSYSYCQNAKLVLKSAKGEQHRMVSIPPCPRMVRVASFEANKTEALQIAIDLLQEERIDAQRMGLESLVHLSEDSSFRLDQAPCETVLDHITSQSSADPLHHSALHILANMLKNRSMEERFLTDKLVSALVMDMEHANANPHNAHLACECLAHFERQRVSFFTDAILVASESGKSSHALLEASSSLLLANVIR